jgi:hypothetical protein
MAQQKPVTPVLLWQEHCRAARSTPQEAGKLAEPGFSVAIIGHRPNRLPARAIAAVTADMELSLLAIASACPDARPWAISSLAEGADRIGAVAALAAGYRLKVILPFSRPDYERDFPDSRMCFANLIALADMVTELSGSRLDPNAAYEAAGLAILAIADLVIAVWDGGPSQGRGGTTETIEAAIAHDLPVLWLDATGQCKPALRHEGKLADSFRTAINGAIS